MLTSPPSEETYTVHKFYINILVYGKIVKNGVGQQHAHLLGHQWYTVKCTIWRSGDGDSVNTNVVDQCAIECCYIF